MSLSFFAICLLSSCIGNKNTTDIESLKKELDSLKIRIEKFKPGLGEFMLSIQIHHNKLWFAGKNANWKLAKFEIDELREQFRIATDVETDRAETKLLSIVYPSLKEIDSAIVHQDVAMFETQYNLLTKACNDCHVEVHFEFNKVKTPDVPIFSNQE